MKNYYEILGLEVGESKEEIEKRYKQLSEELDPANNDNQEFFREEFNKVQEAYRVLIKESMFVKSNLGLKNTSTSKTNDESQSKSINKNSDNFKKDLNMKNKVKKRDLVFGILMSIIGLGIWGVFFQNMGFFVPSEDDAQKVKVINTVDVSGDVDVDGSVRIDGGYMSVDVDNEVDINISSINGHSWFYRHYGDKKDYSGNELYYRLPISD